MAVVLQTADEAGDVKTGCVRLSTSAPLRLITSGEAGKRRRRAGSDRPRLGFQQSACITCGLTCQYFVDAMKSTQNGSA